MRRPVRLLFAAAVATLGGAAGAQLATVHLYAAGSLRDALTEVARQYEAQGGAKVALTLGASGLLRERIEKGEPAQVFASADMDHPQRLVRSGGWQPPVVFARNQMCLLAAPSVQVTSATLLDTLLQPSIRLGTSTPKSDPSGDYAWALFRRAETVRPGAYAVLDAKALKLTGADGLPQAPAGRNTYAWLMEEGKADVFLTYCTGAVAVQRELPRFKVVQVPADLQVGASYGLGVRAGDDAAQQLARYILSAPAQEVLRRYGFGAP
jgi:molybdenum ABC transporter molybdate-binding protein